MQRYIPALRSILRQYGVALFFVLLAALSLSMFAAVAFIGVVLLAGYVIPIKSRNVILRLTLGYLLVYSMVTIVAAVFWVLHIPDALYWSLPLTAVGLGTWFRNVPLVRQRYTVDIIGLIVAGAIGYIVAAPFLHNPNFPTLLQIFSYQGDNISHLELINADITQRGYVYYGLVGMRPYASQTLSGYPQGWHINGAVMQDSLGRLLHISGNAYRQMLFFYAFAVAQFGMLALLMYESVVLLASQWLGRTSTWRQRLLTRLIAAAAVAALFVGPFTTMFSYGFQTLFAAFSLLLAVYLYLSFQDARAGEPRSDRTAYLLAVVSFVSLSMTWQVLTIAAGVALAVVLFYKKLVRLNIRSLLRDWRFVAGLFGLGLAAAFPFYIVEVFGNEANKNIFQPGLSPHPSGTLLLVLTGGVVIIAYLLGKRRLINGPSLAAGALWTTAGLFLLVLYVIMSIKLGRQEYYYYKSAFSVILLSAVILAAGVAYIIATAIKGLRLGSFLVLCAVLVLVGGAAVNADTSIETHAYLQGTLSGMDPNLAMVFASSLVRPDHPKILALGSCIPDQDFKATRIAQALSSDPVLKQIHVANPFEYTPTYIGSVDAFLHTRPAHGTVVISFDHGIAAHIRARFAGNPMLQVIDLDTSNVPKDPAQCPNFVGFRTN